MPRRAPPDAAPERLEGKRITVEVEGDGPDVVLIPGLASPRGLGAHCRTAENDASPAPCRGARIRRCAGPEYRGPDTRADDARDCRLYRRLHRRSRTPPRPYRPLARRSDRHDDRRPCPQGGRTADGSSTACPSSACCLARPQPSQASSRRPHLPRCRRCSPQGIAPKPTSGRWNIVGDSMPAAAQVKAWTQAANAKVAAQLMYDDMTTDLRPRAGRDHAELRALSAGCQRDARSDGRWTLQGAPLRH